MRPATIMEMLDAASYNAMAWVRHIKTHPVDRVFTVYPHPTTICQVPAWIKYSFNHEDVAAIVMNDADFEGFQRIEDQQRKEGNAVGIWRLLGSQNSLAPRATWGNAPIFASDQVTRGKVHVIDTKQKIYQFTGYKHV